MSKNTLQPSRWSRLTPTRKTALVVAGAVQAGLFAAAWRDLDRRTPPQINGSRAGWRAALFLNFVGPLAYFAAGRKAGGWSETDLPDLSGKVAVVTGANSGLGYETSRALAQRGATVVMACRNPARAEAAAAAILATHPSGKVVLMSLDLGDLDSVRRFAEEVLARYDRLDLLVNNAGLMVPPAGQTAQGFETQFGVNHLGHFALTARLIGRLNATPGARVVTVSSAAHRFGQIGFDDLNWKDRPYNAWQAYGQSKLANLLFTYELQRRLAAAGHHTRAVAAHPGYAATNLQGEGAVMRVMNRLLAQPQGMGALPSLYAAAAPQVQGGQYFGPSGPAELGGPPRRVESSARSHNLRDARRLWQVSEELTGVPFTL